MRFIGLLVLLAGLGLANVTHAQLQTPPLPPPVVVRVERVDSRWLAWFNRPTNGVWIIQANTTSKADGWFTPPGYIDDGVRVKVVVPSTPMMFFRAKRIR